MVPTVRAVQGIGSRLAMPINQRLSAVCDKLAIVAKAKAHGIRIVPERRSPSIAKTRGLSAAASAWDAGKRTRHADCELGLAPTLGPRESETAGILSEQSECTPGRLGDHRPPRERRGGRSGPQFADRSSHAPKFFGNADATAAFMSRLIWDDASYHDGVVAKPEGGVPEAEAIASVRVIFDR
jgi:hypothetical protein